MHGYSSSSDTDDEYTRRKHKKSVVPVAANNNDANKKKKKLKLPPQQTINRIWKRFSSKKFSRALAVLPFDPVLPSTISDRSNELLNAGYERAAEECRRKVKKIIQECRRVNTRYRDPGFDLDWDLKYEKGFCLNSLDKTRFDLSMATLMNPSSIVPKAVKRVHEIFEKPTFMKNVSGSDVKQGGLGDCWLVASLSGLANVEEGLKRICVEYDTRIGIYGFVFYRDGEWIYSIIDDKLYLKSPCWDSPSMQRDLLQQIDREDVERVYRKTYQTGSKALFFAQCKDQNETWVPLMEKAYAKAHGDYGCLTGGWIGEGLEDLSGGVTTELLASDILDLDGFWDNELSRVNEEFLFGCSTGLLDGGYGDRNGISEGHAYIVMEARTLKDGTRLVKLRNPWGKTKKGIWEGAWSDGSKEWTTEVQEEVGHQFGNDSVFWISYDDLVNKYQHFDRTRLFRDPEWRCCQRWIGVEVPWKAHFHEKFHIKLTKEGPLVLVLSQLDDRYFKGLDGQYSFRLNFRLHEQDSPEPEDYIVRSHGNYLMERSVSVELPCMLPGTYSVFISVVATRHLTYPSIEQVVKRETKKRKENEKLAQVGYAYDLAHSKASAHFDAIKKLRKKSDQKKASEARQNERKRLWEKRHRNREVTKQQARKNNIKVEAKLLQMKEQEEAEKERKLQEEENKPKDMGVQTETDLKEESKQAENQEGGPQTKAEESLKSDEASQGNAAAKPDDHTDEKKPASSHDDKTSFESKDDNSENDESPDATPVPTPAATPAIEKTEQAAVDGSSNGGLGDAKADRSVHDNTDDKAESEKAFSQTSIGKHDEKPEEKAEDQAGDAVSATSSDTTGSPKYTPKSEDSTLADSKEEKVPVPPVDATSVSGGPPPPPRAATPKTGSSTPSSTRASTNTSSISLNKPAKKPPTYYVTSEGESSASPIEDWEELYSSDDMTRKPRMAAPPPPANLVRKYADDTDDENDPEPWNAMCVIGLRVYSKDEDLELRIVMEGGELEEGGMGEKGGPDLDNAQANAGGARKKVEDDAYEGDSEVDKKGKKKRKDGRGSGDDTEKEEDGMANYATIVQKAEGESEYESAVETKDERADRD